VKVYVGVTDNEWYRQLAGRGAGEVNFWQPSGGRRFGAIPQGAPFLFKTHYPDNRIVGGGFLSGWASSTLSRAWEFFGEDNGCLSLLEMRNRILRYRRGGVGEVDPEIGCIMLRDVRHFSDATAPAAPPDWKSNIVEGKTYEIGEASGSSPGGAYSTDHERRSKSG